MKQSANPYAPPAILAESDELLPFGPGTTYSFQGFPTADELIEIDRLRSGASGIGTRIVARVVFCYLLVQCLVALGYALLSGRTSLAMSSIVVLGLLSLWLFARQKNRSLLAEFANSMNNANGSREACRGSFFNDGLFICLNSKQYCLTWHHFTNSLFSPDVGVLYLQPRGRHYVPFAKSQFSDMQVWNTFRHKVQSEIQLARRG